MMKLCFLFFLFFGWKVKIVFVLLGLKDKVELENVNMVDLLDSLCG